MRSVIAAASALLLVLTCTAPSVPTSSSPPASPAIPEASAPSSASKAVGAVRTPAPGAADGSVMASCDASVKFSPQPPKVFQARSGRLDLDVVSQIGGPARSLALAGDRLYVGMADHIDVLDVSDPTKMRRLGSSATFADAVRGIAIAGQIAIAAVGVEGIVILDLADPDRPKALASLPLDGSAEAVALAGSIAYVANGPGGVALIDITDPRAPRRIANAVASAYAMDIALSGTRAYVAAGGTGVVPLDLADPARPVERKPIPVGGFSFGVALAGNTLVVAAGWEGIAVIDVTEPLATREVGRLRTSSWAMRATADGGRAYVAAASAGLRIVDPSKLDDLRGLDMPTGHAGAVVARGRMAYVADLYHGVRAIDVGGDTPRQVATYSPLPTALDVTLIGDVAYVAAGSAGVRAVNVADPAAWRELSSFPTLDDVIGVAPAGGALLATSVGPVSSVFLLDVSVADRIDSAQPQPLFGSGVYRGGTVQGTTAFWTNEWGLAIFDAGGPRPCALGFLQTTNHPGGPEPDEALAADVSGTIAYVGLMGPSGLLAVDVSDPRQPKIVSKLSAPGRGFDGGVLATERYVYALDPESVFVIDAADPTSLRIVGTLRLPAQPGGSTGWNPQKLALAGGQLLVADGAAGLLAVDVSTPSAPRIATRVVLTGVVTGVAVRGEYVYAWTHQGGLTILRWRDQASLDPPPPRGPAPNGPLGAAAPSRGAAGPRPASLAARAPRPLAQSGCVVTSVDDGGPETLRDCLARAAAGTVITFDPAVFSPSTPGVIRTQGFKMGMTGGVTIDARGAVILSGPLESQDPKDLKDPKEGAFGIMVLTDGNVIKGLRVRGFGTGVIISGRGNTIGGSDPADRNVLSDLRLPGATATLVRDNFIGTDPSGSSPRAAPFYTLALESGASSNRIEGNVIGGRIVVNDLGTSYNEFVGNFIGVDRSGTSLSGGSRPELAVQAPFNRIGGTVASDRNVIHGTIRVAAPDVFVLGNDVRTRPGPSAPYGVELESGAGHSFVGGPSAAETNVIGGGAAGVFLRDHASRCFVVGNEIFGGARGIVVESGRRNVIQGNEIHGTGTAIELLEEAQRNTVSRNLLRANGRDRDDRGVDNVFR